jgi:hypothetical protein
MTNLQQDFQRQTEWADELADPNQQHPIEDRYNTHDTSFRRHYQLTYADTPNSYAEFYAPAYRFGFTLSEENPATKWDAMKTQAQEQWQTLHTSAWPEIAAAVRYGWTEQRRPEALRFHHYGEFSEYRTAFEQHYRDVLKESEFAFAHYEPAYQYGYTLAVDPNYSHAHLWSEVEPELRQYYETEYSSGELSWERYHEAAQHAWHEVRASGM